MFMMKFAGPALCALCLPGAAAAATVLEVAGAKDTSGFGAGPDQVYDGNGFTFTLAGDLQDAAISVDLLCVIGDCEGQIFLTKDDITQGAPSVLSLAGVNTFDVATSFGGTGLTVFDALSLTAGTYSLQLTFTSGLGALFGTTAPILTENFGASVGSAIAYKSINPLLPGFELSQAESYTPLFTVTGTVPVDEPAPVPLPAGLVLLGGALLALRRLRS
ncbi:MAG: hypothetical protein KJN93_06995 [Alphaproteobacteria bacterium]|nr:hypothetical protein [Alphaproteobacteria bacterium]